MTLSELEARLAVSVDRSDLTYADFINDALRQIQQRRNWWEMRDTADVTISAGMSESSPITRFKELRSNRTPIHSVNADGRLVEVDVLTRASLLRRSTPILSVLRLQCYIERNDEVATIKLADNTAEDVALKVYCYRFLEDLSAAGDSNFLTNDYPQMVLALTKALCFEAVNDPEAAVAEELYEKRYREASRTDARQEVAGLDLHM